MAQSPEAALQSMIDNLAQKTGKPLADWVGVVRSFNSMCTHRVRLESPEAGRRGASRLAAPGLRQRLKGVPRGSMPVD
jgi:hypothetical protein